MWTASHTDMSQVSGRRAQSQSAAPTSPVKLPKAPSSRMATGARSTATSTRSASVAFSARPAIASVVPWLCPTKDARVAFATWSAWSTVAGRSSAAISSQEKAQNAASSGPSVAWRYGGRPREFAR